MQDQGGWLNRDIIQKFAEYATASWGKTGLGDRVKHWAVLNEPTRHALFGHGIRFPRAWFSPDGPICSPLFITRTWHRELHCRHSARSVPALSSLAQCSRCSRHGHLPVADEDYRAAERFDAMWNGTCLDPLLRGSYPSSVANDFTPLIMEGDLVTTRQQIDYLGVNYYTPMYITYDPQSLFGAWFGARPPNMPSTAMDWPIDAAGLTEGLIRLRDHYGNPEVYVTENGACFNDLPGADGTVSDVDRITYLRAHLAAAQDALEVGVKLRGYFVWSLLDNFEWQEGYSRRFGVIYVDFQDAQACAKGVVPVVSDTYQRLTLCFRNSRGDEALAAQPLFPRQQPNCDGARSLAHHGTTTSYGVRLFVFLPPVLSRRLTHFLEALHKLSYWIKPAPEEVVFPTTAANG